MAGLINQLRLNKNSRKGRGEGMKMKATINGKRYDSNRCEIIAEKDCYSDSNNLCGGNYLLLAKDGQFLYMQTSNGQDLYRNDCLSLFSESEMTIDEFDLTDDQEKRAVELGLIEIV